MGKKKSKPSKKDEALKVVLEEIENMNKKNFTDFNKKLKEYIDDAFDEINNSSAMELIEKCGKGPSTGFVDGVQYRKDHQRVTNGKSKVGDLEGKHLQSQLDMSVADDGVAKYMDRLDEYPYDAIGYGLFGEEYAPQDVTFGEEYDEVGAWSGRPYGIFNPSEEFSDALDFDEATKVFDQQMNNAPHLQDNVMLFTQDTPNPELEEGDVFELDTFLGVNFKKGLVGKRESWTDVDIATTRDNGTMYNSTYYSSYDSHNIPYDVTVLGSEGTPLLMIDPYRSSSTPSHNGILNKGQKVRLVRVNHEKRTAIYQTVEG